MKYRDYIDFVIQYIVIGHIYPHISDIANSSRGYVAIGGEIMLWLMPIMILLVRAGRAIDRRQAK